MKRWLPFVKSPPVVSVVRLQGAIGAGPRGLSDRAVAPLLEKAFSRGKPAAVALEINSPGGSAVQSSMIGARIRRLAEEKDVPVYAFVEDVAASGGYWLAASADEIWLDESSVVGSIGVIAATFGAHEAIARLGIERRVYTAGESKSQLDPFRPEKPADVERLKEILEQIHGTFIGHVRRRRGEKLPEGKDLFTGNVWVGQAAVETGLADGVGHLTPKMKERFGEKVRFVRYGRRRGLAERFGAQVLAATVDQLEERAAFARFGL
jgi:serine protease SohB